jgi:hypothetical protein
MPELKGSTRRVLKATYVRLTPDGAIRVPRGALQKFGFVQQLDLQPGEVSAVHAAMKAQGTAPTSSALWQRLKHFESGSAPAQPPSTDAFANTNVADLVALGNALATLRQAQLNETPPPADTSAKKPAHGKHASPAPSVAVAPSAADIANAPLSTAALTPADASAAAPSPTTTAALTRLNAGAAATFALQQSADVMPIGMLNLERLEMTPAGIEQGELLATIPLAPLEQTAVAQKEWSVTTKEFTSIVTDSLENYSETGVTENTELAQSTSSQIQHSNQFNVNATVSGGVGFVTGTVSSGFQAQDQHSDSATASTKHATATTKKASSRVKQEHKTTISTTTVTGTSESTTRTLSNPSQTNAIRIDYFSMMRKWHVGLYRYGLRLTYDIVIPEPGAALRETYEQLAALQAALATPFTFQLPYSAITATTYQTLAAKYGAQVQPPPKMKILTVGGNQVVGINPNDTGQVTFTALSFDVDPGYWITEVWVTGYFGQNSWQMKVIGHNHTFSGSDPQVVDDMLNLTLLKGDAGPWGNANLNFMQYATGSQTLSFSVRNTNPATVTFLVKTEPQDGAYEQWQSSVWNALYNAAQTTWYANQQLLQAKIQTLQDKINSVDTLTLRREENDEIMKGVLRWILGPNFNFNFMPPNVRQALRTGPYVGQLGDWGITPVSSEGFTPPMPWAVVQDYEQIVRFVNDAIDWENVLYYLYSYFWDLPNAWVNLRSIQHPDATRQAFLRAGSARVVLTVRKGWETAWVNFAESGLLNQTSQSPYLPVAAQIQDFDTMNYPGIPPADPSGVIPPDDGRYAATTSSDKVAPSPNAPVKLNVVSSDGFIVGYTAIIDAWDAASYAVNTHAQGLQEAQKIVAIDPDGKHITVAALNNAHDGSQKPFAIIQAGEKGVLVSEWFEYTPTSGTDIALTSKLTTIS